MRPLVSYDDITTPHLPDVTNARNPVNPSKKRKRNNSQKSQNINKRQLRGQPTRYVQHWDDPGMSSQPVSYDEDGNEEYGADEVEEEESRELTHDEIWDDTALIDAWNAASEEYEAFHGPDKSWKTERIHKSALWYNVPTSPSRLHKSVEVDEPSVQPLDNSVESQDSHPVDFDTFMPTHDASLSHQANDATGLLPPPDSLASISQDEAFEKALNSMYWTGYWTAVYHCRKSRKDVNEHYQRTSCAGQDKEGDREAVEDDSSVKEDLVPSQR